MFSHLTLRTSWLFHVMATCRVSSIWSFSCTVVTIVSLCVPVDAVEQAAAVSQHARLAARSGYQPGAGRTTEPSALPGTARLSDLPEASQGGEHNGVKNALGTASSEIATAEKLWPQSSPQRVSTDVTPSVLAGIESTTLSLTPGAAGDTTDTTSLNGGNHGVSLSESRAVPLSEGSEPKGGARPTQRVGLPASVETGSESSVSSDGVTDDSDPYSGSVSPCGTGSASRPS